MELSRRTFLAAGVAGTAGAMMALATQEEKPTIMHNGSDREYWITVAQRIARPVLNALSKGELKSTMTVQNGRNEDRSIYACLEAIGRLTAGIAPWLELSGGAAGEVMLRNELLGLTQTGIAMAVDPTSPDFVNLEKGSQPLVDSAFLAHGLLRAPTQLWAKLPEKVKGNVISAVESTRRMKPGNNNWLLFSAMIEAFLCKAGETWKEDAVALALSKHAEWYKGDGVYGDGPTLHWDSYNSFVIHPMLLDVLGVVADKRPEWATMLDTEKKRAQRYAAIQERWISPEGTFPGVGRSMAYRFGAFQLLAQMALRKELPQEVMPAQVRSGLTAVIRRMTEAPGTFDDKGFLRIGFCGHQPGIAESYISTGSLYLCACGLLPLGLSEQDEFWNAPAADWTEKKLWSGKDVPADHAITG